MAGNDLPALRPDTSQAPVSVQRTDLSIDVLGRFLCSTWDEAVGNDGAPFDVVIVGSGMFGAYAADKIYRDGKNAGLRVLVLEAGPFLVSTHVQNLPDIGLNVPSPMAPSQDNGQPQDLVWGLPWRSNQPYIGLAYCVGGKSLFWGGWCPRLLDSDLKQWPSDVAAYLNANYKIIEDQTGVTDKTDFIQGALFDSLKKSAQNVVSGKKVTNLDSVEDPPLAVQGQSPASGLFAFDKFSSLTPLISALRNDIDNAFNVNGNSPDTARRLFVMPNAHVIRFQVSNGVVTGIEVDFKGQRKILALAPNCAVLLSASIIESTRLALLSFPTSSNRGQELIGRNLISHIRTNLSFQVKRTAFDPTGTLTQALQTGAILVRGSTPAGKFHFQITTSAGQDGNSDVLLYTMIPDIDQLDSVLAQQTSDWINITIRAESQMIGDKTTPVGQAIRWIDLSPFEIDEYGAPRAFVSLNTTPSEEALANDMNTAISALAMKFANDDPASIRGTGVPGRDSLGSTYHEAGTLWMGTEPRESTAPEKSVTDVNGHFHHVTNAYCVDQSLFVTVGSVNPTLTGLTLTRKVAESLVNRYVSTDAQATPPGFQDLFTGALAQWSIAPQGAQNFRVLQGLNILEAGNFGGGPDLGIIYFKAQQFQDFRLIVDWKAFSVTANSGVFLRMPEPLGQLTDAFYAGFTEIQIDERGFDPGLNQYGSSLHKTGAIYSVFPAQQWAAKSLSQFNSPGFWNRYEIKAQGNLIEVKLNGALVSTGQVTGKPASGFIGLQCHTAVVQFRDIRIQPL